ncbi:MAG: hypothetical protein JETCAE03_33230 [Ignavibacteriaceae bacterium]|jgi:hypothetical protein|nr:MAG: hypothetical protein JETCAE03_33230 [Ignavibacteriaceae bacterium]
MPQKQKPHVDLTDKKALVAAFNKHPQDLWASFGTAPLFKDYNVNNVIDYIESVIKKDSVHISPEKKEEIFINLQKFGNNGRKAMQYIGNVFLRGAGLGLRDHQEKLLRQVIREEIKNVLKEKDLGIKYSEQQWNKDDSEEEKQHFFKKFRGLGHPWKITTDKKILGLSFKELPSDIQKAWDYYIHKMK